jgi:hypothetical protein
MNITADNEIMLGQALGFLLLFVMLLRVVRRCDEFGVVRIESYPHRWIFIKPNNTIAVAALCVWFCGLS